MPLCESGACSGTRVGLALRPRWSADAGDAFGLGVHLQEREVRGFGLMEGGRDLGLGFVGEAVPPFQFRNHSEYLFLVTAIQEGGIGKECRVTLSEMREVVLQE